MREGDEELPAQPAISPGGNQAYKEEEELMEFKMKSQEEMVRGTARNRVGLHSYLTVFKF